MISATKTEKEDYIEWKLSAFSNALLTILFSYWILLESRTFLRSSQRELTCLIGLMPHLPIAKYWLFGTWFKLDTCFEYDLSIFKRLIFKNFAPLAKACSVHLLNWRQTQSSLIAVRLRTILASNYCQASSQSIINANWLKLFQQTHFKLLQAEIMPLSSFLQEELFLKSSYLSQRRCCV